MQIKVDSMKSEQLDTSLKYRGLIIGLSVGVPIAVALLFFIRIKGADFSFLPPFYATLNACTAVTLLVAFWAIKNKKIALHRALMTTSIVFSSLFLVSYVLYHATTDPTHFGGQGVIKYVYFFILISHILLSITIVPLVLITYVRALSKQFPQHRKIARYTFPIWLYVAVTGVIVYLMIAPYYG